MRIDIVFRAIGSFCVRFRWLVVAAWVAGAIAAVTLLPALSSVTQGNNAKFLPASAPSEHAAALAAPFGTAGLLPIPVVAARSGASLTPADVAALASLRADLGKVASVGKVIDLGRSPDGQAEQLVVLASQAGGGQNQITTLVRRATHAIAHAGLPTGLQAHLAGSVAVQVDQQKASGNTGSQVQNLSSLFIIVLLVVIFRSFTLALTTIAPAIFSVLISGPLVAEAAQHGLQVSPLAQYLMIVLVLGAGTDYGLFLVFRVREELRAAQHDQESYESTGFGGLLRALGRDLFRPRPPAREAIITSVTRVGESITFSAGTVIAAVLTLLLASFPFYSNLAIPFAIAIGVILLSGLTLLPALLSIRLSLLAVKRTIFQASFGRPKLLPWSIQGSGKIGVWGRIAGRIVQHPVPTLVAGLIFFGGLAFAVLGYQASGFGGNTTPPAGSDSAAGTSLLATSLPAVVGEPDQPDLPFRAAGLAAPGDPRLRRAPASGQRAVHHRHGPAQPGRRADAPRPVRGPAHPARPGQRPSRDPATGHQGAAACLRAYRATGNYVSADGQTVQYLAGLKAGDPGGTPALRVVPSVRTATTRVAASVRAADSAVGGEAPALYDISSISNSDLAKVIPIAILAIGLLLAVVLRSLVAPLYLIASRRILLPGGTGPGGAAVHRDRRERRAGVLPALPHVHLPAGPR